MSSRAGRKPTPTVLKLRRGEPKKGRYNWEEPEVPTEKPRKPHGLSKAESAEWDRMIDTLQRMGLLSSAYRAALITYVQVWAQRQEILKQVKADGLIVDGPRGRQRHPLLGTARELEMSVNRWLTEFGLTPSAGTRVKTAMGSRPNKKTKPGKTPLSEFLA